MRIQNKIIALIATVVLLSTLGTVVQAHDVIDSSKKGSISATMYYENAVVSGGSLTLYQVGDVHQDNGNYVFVPTGDFKKFNGSLNDIGSTGTTESAELAESLSVYVQENKLSGITKDINSEGKVSFEDLELGLYLCMQNTAADGYEKINPFLVSVPMVNEDEEYVYVVDASPKVDLSKSPTTTTPETTSETTQEPTTTPSTPPKSPVLPQTGQLNWPVPVMAVMGMALFSEGWVLRYGKKKKKEDA